jgi:uncharacterized membrane protein (DUF373 family)
MKDSPAQDWLQRPGSTRGARARHPLLTALNAANTILHCAVAIVLLAVATIVLWHAAYDVITSHQPFVNATTSAINGVLFTIIILEVVRTVLAHLESGAVQLQPFLVVGAISAVRSILGVGARLSLQGTEHPPTTAVVHAALLELAVNAAAVLALVIALVLVRRVAGITEG